MSTMQNIQWFPGHMTKTKRKIQASLKLVDAVAEIVDARIPYSSRNPELDKLIGNKPRLILLNKCDMADSRETQRWIAYFQKTGKKAIAIDCKSGRGVSAFIPAVRQLLSGKIKKQAEKGITGRTISVMVVGIPNVGKSSFINRMARKSRAKAEDRPGVTRGNQWYSIGQGFEILDTPGVLWPKFDDPKVGEKLAFTGAVKDQIIDVELLAVRLLEVLKVCPTDKFLARFKLLKEELAPLDGYALLQLIAKKRGMLMAGGQADTLRAANILLDEYRSAKLGTITLERAENV